VINLHAVVVPVVFGASVVLVAMAAAHAVIRIALTRQ